MKHLWVFIRICRIIDSELIMGFKVSNPHSYFSVQFLMCFEFNVEFWFATPFGLNNDVTETGIIIVVECRLRYTQALLMFHAIEHPLEITSNSLLANLQINIFNLWQILNLLKLHWAMFIILITLFGLNNWTFFIG